MSPHCEIKLGGVLILYAEPLALSLGVAVLSALVPLISAEVYVVGLVAYGSNLPWWAIGIVLAVGQVAGKLAYYYGGRGSLKLPRLIRRKSDKVGRWGARLARFRDTCRRRPVFAFSFMLVSATCSLPPFAATSIVAGAAKIRLSSFIVAGLVGRFIRFGSLAAFPVLLDAWLF